MSRGREAAVFLDRDGVINAHALDPLTGTAESPYDPADVRLLPGVADAILALAERYLLVVVSNQPAAAKGTATPAALDAVHERVLELLGPAADAIAAWRYCRHHPEAIDPALRECECRKPKPGLLLDAAEELGIDLGSSWMVGDAERDIEAGVAAGCRTILVETADSAHRRGPTSLAELRVHDLRAAADAILA